MYKYLVLHYSQNWMMDGLAIERFESLKEAKDYIKGFRGSDSHKKDSYQVVKVLSSGKAVKKGKQFGFRTTP